MHGTGAGPKVLTFKRAVSPPPLGEEGPAEMIDAAASAQSMALDTVVGKRKLNELVEQIGPDEKLEPEAEEVRCPLRCCFCIPVDPTSHSFCSNSPMISFMKLAIELAKLPSTVELQHWASRICSWS